jgi:tRNA modification GTPase
MLDNSTIVAIATPPGMGAIAVIRVSGSEAITLTNGVFRPVKTGKSLLESKPYTLHYGEIVDLERVIDEVLVSVFHAPHSYTGENAVEISCHGSVVIQQQILELLIRRGARLAQPGEFTLRAFLNGKMDLSQAEAVADIIASTSEAERRVAMQQMRGGFSDKLKLLREQLLKFTALIELELDFSEEDVEFADRKQLEALVCSIHEEVSRLADSFSMGNAIKQGIPVTIAGKPNVGKSTLLNRLLNEEKAIVSEIAGTTRDAIEDNIQLAGMNFRFIDTAGLRHTTDEVESLGIARTHSKIEQAKVVLYLIDAAESMSDGLTEIEKFQQKLTDQQTLMVLLNKADKAEAQHTEQLARNIESLLHCKTLIISAKSGQNINELTQSLVNIGVSAQPDGNNVVVTNARHYESLVNARESLENVLSGLKSNLTGDLLAVDIHQALYHLGSITGEITNDEVLGYIFSKFCIGK